MGPGTVTVTTPASSANLGPGFDSFGLALELRNRFTATLADEWNVEVRGEGAGVLAEGAGNRVAEAMACVFAEAGRTGLSASLTCENAIPAGRGLGSSAAAIVGGLLLADRLCDAGLSARRLLELATGLEGHPDNVAAALLGGFTIAWDDSGPRARRIEPGLGVAVVAVTTDASLATSEARSMLPAEVPHADAAFNAGRAGALAAGLALGDRELIAAGLADRIHEGYRERAVPDLELVKAALLAAGATGATLSGAGPTVIGLVTESDDVAAFALASDIAGKAAERIAGSGGRCEPRVLGVARNGARVE